jgi:hypothetical protein
LVAESHARCQQDGAPKVIGINPSGYNRGNKNNPRAAIEVLHVMTDEEGSTD